MKIASKDPGTGHFAVSLVKSIYRFVSEAGNWIKRQVQPLEKKLEDESSDNSENQAGNKKMGDIKLYNRPIMTHQGSKLLSNENQEQTTKQRNNN